MRENLIWREFNLAIFTTCQTAKLKSSQNFPAIRYVQHKVFLFTPIRQQQISVHVMSALSMDRDALLVFMYFVMQTYQCSNVFSAIGSDDGTRVIKISAISVQYLDV